MAMMQRGVTVNIGAAPHRCNPPRQLAKELMVGHPWRCQGCGAQWRLDHAHRFRPEAEARQA